MAGMALPRSMAALYGRGIDRGLVLGGGGVWFVAWQTGYLRRLEELGRVIVAACLVIVAVIFAIEWRRSGGVAEVLLRAVSLAVAAVPEGLPGQLLLPTSDERISLLPSSTALAVLERQSPGQNGLGLVIAKSLAQLWQDFDYALIDSPPLLGVLMVNALAASQQLVIPVQTEFLAVKGLERMVGTLAMVNRSRKQALPYQIVPTLFDRRTQASLATLKLLRDTYGQHVWQGYIPVDTRLRDASRKGVTPSQFDSKSRGLVAYRALLKHLLTYKTAAQVA